MSRLIKIIRRAFFTFSLITFLGLFVVAQFSNKPLTHDTSALNFVCVHIDTVGINTQVECYSSILADTYNNEHNKFTNKQSQINKSQSVAFDTVGIYVRQLFSSTAEIRFESYSNPFNSVEYIKNFNEGRLTECGFVIDKNQKIGIWKYISPNGQIDSIVNYETKREMSFCEFYRIANLFGLVGNKLLPERNILNRIAESKGFSIVFQNSLLNKPGWSSLAYIGQKRILEDHMFNSIFSYRQKEKGDEWSVIKFLDDGNKKYGFGLTLNCRTSEIFLYEVKVTI